MVLCHWNGGKHLLFFNENAVETVVSSTVAISIEIMPNSTARQAFEIPYKWWKYAGRLNYRALGASSYFPLITQLSAIFYVRMITIIIDTAAMRMSTLDTIMRVCNQWHQIPNSDSDTRRGVLDCVFTARRCAKRGCATVNCPFVRLCVTLV